MQKLQQLSRSRKFWAALIGLALVIVRAWWPTLPLSDEQASKAVALLVAYILGVSLEDGLAGLPKAGRNG